MNRSHLPSNHPTGRAGAVPATASVTTRDHENFNGRGACLSRGARIPDLRHRRLGGFEEVKSARVACTG